VEKSGKADRVIHATHRFVQCVGLYMREQVGNLVARAQPIGKRDLVSTIEEDVLT